MNRKEMLEAGWIEKKEFWTKKGKYFGTWICNKHSGSPSQIKKRLLKKEGNVSA